MTRSRSFRSAVVLGVAVGLIGAVLGVVPAVLEWEEGAALPWLYARRGRIEPPGAVHIVAMSEDSARALGVSPQSDEWPRSLHADLIDRLTEAKAAAIVFDLYFVTDRAHDEELAQAIDAAANVILLERVRSDPIEEPGTDHLLGIRETRVPLVASIKAAALGSAPFVLPVVPLRTNQFWTFGRSMSDMPTLPVVALQAYLLEEYELLITLLREVRPEAAAGLPPTRADALRSRRLEEVIQRLRGEFAADPDLARAVRAATARAALAEESVARLQALLDVYGGEGHRFLSYYGPAGTIGTTAYHEALDAANAARFTGQVVFVGYSETRQPEQQDDFISVFSERSGQNLSGVEIGATAFANLLERRRIEPLSPGAQALMLLAFGLACGVLFSLLPVFWAVAAAIAVAGGYAGAAIWQFIAADLWLPLIVPVYIQLPLALFGVLLWTYHRVRTQRERIQAAFGYYLPQREVQRLLMQQGDLAAGGELLHGTCLFTDAEQYTTVSERMQPAELRDLLNRYYEVMLEVVQRHDGFVSDFAGDSMVAIWASPKHDAVNAIRAGTAALEIIEALTEFNRARGSAELPTGIGLDSGPVLIGNVGAHRRFEYRAVGDIVSTAARLQGLNRVLRTRVVASAAVVQPAIALPTRNLGRFLLRGKLDALDVHEIVASGTAGDLLLGFEDALALFQRGEWNSAGAAFADLARRYPEDGPTRYYAGLSAQYASSPPSEWEGVVTIVTK